MTDSAETIPFACALLHVCDRLDRCTQTVRDYLTLAAMPIVTTHSGYDAGGRRTQLSAMIDTTDDFVTDFSYDALHRMIGIVQSGVTGGNGVAEKRVDLSYNADNQFNTISRYADLVGNVSVASTSFLHDGTGRLTDLTHTQAATTLAGYRFSYDNASRLTEIDSLIDGLTTFTHDVTGQLTAADHASQTDEAYTYDENGNRIGTGMLIGTNNRLLSDGAYDYLYDAEGNRTRKTHLVTGEQTDYVWDFHNNLIDVVVTSAASVVLRTVRYGYDGLNQKVWREITDASGTQTETYVHDGLRSERGSAGDQLILRFDGSGEITNRYLHGPAVDQVFADEQISTPGTAGETLWPLTDHLGSVRDIAQHDAASGITSVTNHIVYDSYGNRMTFSINDFFDLF